MDTDNEKPGNHADDYGYDNEIYIYIYKYYITIMIMIMILYSKSDKNDTEHSVIRMMIIRTTGFPRSFSVSRELEMLPISLAEALWVAKQTPTPSR